MYGALRASFGIVLLGGAARLEPADRVLVPLADAEWAARIRVALRDIEGARYRAAIDHLQVGLTEGEGAVVQAPEDLPLDAAALRRAMESLDAPPPAEDGGETEAPWGVSRRFIAVRALAHRALACLPGEGLRLYRELYDVRARDLLERHRSGREPLALETAARAFFFTSVGDEAAELAGDVSFEEGSWRTGVTWWRQVLLDHPDRDEPREGLRLKLLDALELLGDHDAWKLERESFVRAVGRDPPGAPSATDEPGPARAGIGAAADLPPRLELGRWGGELRRGELPSLAGSALVGSWRSRHWSQKGLDPAAGPGEVAARQPFRPYYPQLQPLYPFLPVVDDKSLYLSGVYKLFRFDAGPDRGSLVAEYVKPTPRHIEERLPYVERDDSALYTTTIWAKDETAHPDLESLPRKVLITHYVSDRVQASSFMSYDITVEIPIRSLVAFDADTRAVLWKTGPTDGAARRMEDLGQALPRSQVARQPRSELSYTSPVIVKDGLVVAGGWVQRGYVDSVLRALDLRDGRTVWETFISGGQLELTMFGEMAREPFAGAIAEQEGIIYYLNQFGVIAAVELASGRVRWITTYDTIDVRATWQRSAEIRDTCWGANPLLLLGNVLIATPRDSQYLYAIDTGTGPAGEMAAGRVLWRFHNTSSLLRDLLGAKRGKVYFTGPRSVGALDLSGLDAYGHFGKTGAAAEGAPFAVEPRRLYRDLPGSQIVGPGVLTDEGVLFADEKGLYLAGPELGPPVPLVLESAQVPGRLSVAHGMVYMTSRTQLAAYGPPPPAR
jgi:outer membrane protein assembly factor BamB